VVLIGLAFDRRLHYLARKSLFRGGLFQWFMEYMDVIPIDRDGFGFSGLKETLRRLQRGEAVLIFPEGTRTWDGDVGPFKPGLTAVVRRCRASLVPVGADGAFDAWPRTRRWPGLAVVDVVIGEPISPELAASLTDRGLVEELERRVRACHERARRGRLRRGGRRNGFAEQPTEGQRRCSG
jgi:1-acyl-sn-glycerol-3-phosphate acyltransferase